MFLDTQYYDLAKQCKFKTQRKDFLYTSFLNQSLNRIGKLENLKSVINLSCVWIKMIKLGCDKGVAPTWCTRLVSRTYCKSRLVSQEGTCIAISLEFHWDFLQKLYEGFGSHLWLLTELPGTLRYVPRSAASWRHAREAGFAQNLY